MPYLYRHQQIITLFIHQKKSTMKRVFASVYIMLAIIACSPKTAPSSAASVSGMPELANVSSSESDINAGQVIFTSKCTKCHGAKTKYVTGHSYAEAVGVLNKMSQKAKLSQEEIGQLAAYVNSVAKK